MSELEVATPYVLPVIYSPDGASIRPCPDLPWHVEVAVGPPVLVREWHAADCPVFDDPPEVAT